MHGIPRATNDVDIVIAPTRVQLLSLVKLYDRAGYYVAWEEASAALEQRGQFNVIDFTHGWKVDLIVRKSRDFSTTEFDRRENVEIEGQLVVVATPEDVLIAKLEWAKIGNSEQQLIDAAGIVQMQGDDLDCAYIERWVESLDLRDEWNAARNKKV